MEIFLLKKCISKPQHLNIAFVNPPLLSERGDISYFNKGKFDDDELFQILTECFCKRNFISEIEFISLHT